MLRLLPVLPRALACGLVVTILATGCGDSGHDTETAGTDPVDPGTGSTPALVSSQPPGSPTSGTQPPSTGPGGTVPATSPTSVPTGDPAVTCDAPEGSGSAGGVAGDIDGDSRADLVRHAVDPATGTAAVEVCPSTATGGFTFAGLGQGELLELADLTGDGVFDVVYGSTAALARSSQVITMRAGVPVVVATEEGSALVLTDGWPEGLAPDGPRMAWGCDEAGGLPALITLELHIATGAPDITGTWAAWRLDDAVARLVETSEVTGSAGEDPVTAMDALVESWAPAC